MPKENTKGSGDRIVLGIDPGTARCGYALLKLKVTCPQCFSKRCRRESKKGKVTKKTELLDCGLIETPAKTTLSERLETIFNKISALIKKYQPAEMAIEELFFVKNIKTGMSVAHARGVIMLAGRLAKIPIFEYKPNEVKLAIAGHGHASKDQMTKMVGLHLKGCAVKQDDTVDAISVALCHLQIRKHPNAPESGPESAPKKRTGILYQDLSYKIVGVLYGCYNQLGSGLQERYYQTLAKDELKRSGLRFDDQRKLSIKGLPSYLGRYFPDFVIEEKIVLELKVGSRIKKRDVDQTMAYLRQSGKELAIIALFGQNGVITRRLLLGYSGAKFDKSFSGVNLGHKFG